MTARPDITETICILLTAFVVMILLAINSLPATAEPMAPEDIVIELNGEKFQYGDTLKVTIYGDNNTTYRFFIEDKSLFLRLKYIPIWCNWSGVGTASRTLIKPDETPDPEFELSLEPRWHIAYIKLPNVTSNPKIEFKVEYTQEDMYRMFLETSEDVKETDKEEGFWNTVRICFVLIILFIVGVIIAWKKIKPYKARLGEPKYDKKYGVMIRPFREYTLRERILIFIATTLKWGHIKHKMRRKQSKTPYHSRNIAGDTNPPEKMKQRLDSNKKYLKELEKQNTGLLNDITITRTKLDELRTAPEVEWDTRAIDMKERGLVDLREKRTDVGNKIIKTTKVIKTQEIELEKLMEEEGKGVFLK